MSTKVRNDTTKVRNDTTKNETIKRKKITVKDKSVQTARGGRIKIEVEDLTSEGNLIFF